MRALVVGTVPPPGGPAARRLAAIAATRLASGDEVTVLSPDPRSAAHVSASLRGIGLALQLLRFSRRHDALELRIETGLPFAPETSRLTRAAVLLALGAALRRYADVTVRLDTPVPIPGGVGGRATALLWRSVSRVVVGNDEDRAMLEKVPELSEEQVLIESAAHIPGPERPARWPSGTEPRLRDVVQSEIRRAAADEAELRVARRELADPPRESRSALAAPGIVRPSAKVLAEAVVGVSRQRGLGLVRRQWATRTAGSRSR